MSENQDHAQPPIKTQKPLAVVFVTANQTGDPEKVVVKGPKSTSSPEISPRSPRTFSAELSTGSYTVSAGPHGASATLKVGPYRASSQNDLLLP